MCCTHWNCDGPKSREQALGASFYGSYLVPFQLICRRPYVGIAHHRILCVESLSQPVASALLLGIENVDVAFSAPIGGKFHLDGVVMCMGGYLPTHDGQRLGRAHVRWEGGIA